MESNFSVLMVCTGNICRSPLAERLLSAQVQDLSEVCVSSAGNHARVGEQMDAETQQIAQSYGVDDVGSHRARQISEGIVESADLILTMTRVHRRDVVELSPRVTRRTFTLREFARLAEATSDEMLGADLKTVNGSAIETLRAAVQSVALSRSLVPSVTDAAEDEVIDPYRQSSDVHEKSAQQLVPAVNTVANLLRRALAVTST